jgi:tetratricopeptide (TPR) repeat protein
MPNERAIGWRAARRAAVVLVVAVLPQTLPAQQEAGRLRQPEPGVCRGTEPALPPLTALPQPAATNAATDTIRARRLADSAFVAAMDHCPVLAASIFTSAIALAPLQRALYLNAAWAYGLASRPADARVVLRAGVARLPGDGGLWQALGDIEGTPVAALCAYSQALRVDGRRLGAWIGVGRTLSAAGRHGDAAAVWERVARLAPWYMVQRPLPPDPTSTERRMYADQELAAAAQRSGGVPSRAATLEDVWALAGDCAGR